MATFLLDHTATLKDCERTFADNAPPIMSADQAERLIRAATLLRAKLPEESESAGVRVRLRDLQGVIDEASRYRSVNRQACRRTRVTEMVTGRGI